MWLLWDIWTLTATDSRVWFTGRNCRIHVRKDNYGVTIIKSVISICTSRTAFIKVQTGSVPLFRQSTRFSRAKMTALEAGVSLVAREDINWRKDLISQLRERNRSQTNCFADLISLRKFHTLIYIESTQYMCHYILLDIELLLRSMLIWHMLYLIWCRL